MNKETARTLSYILVDKKTRELMQERDRLEDENEELRKELEEARRLNV